MRVRIVPFARLRELLGAASLEREQREGATAGDLWGALASEFPALVGLEGSTRFVRNGAFVDRQAVLREGDELALLPPYGGG
ncbi:MAG: MoaD/ThiS family protein [Vulcanimicrobiaceae bacterium]